MNIVDYPNYLIYPDGRVYSKKRTRTKGGFIKLKKERNGYLRVHLCNDVNTKFFTVHRLVALHYIDNPYNYPDVDHINRNKEDNRKENLRWVTKSMNNHNKGMMVTNTTGIKNIQYIKNKNKYVWKFVKHKNKKVHSKIFNTKQDALWYKIIYSLLFS